MPKYPKKVCDICGIEANRLTSIERYGREPRWKKHRFADYKKAKCDICGRKTRVTTPDSFFLPNFKLLD